MKEYIEEIGGIQFKMVYVEGGKFMMGEGKKEHPVKVPDFYMAEYLVTQELYASVMGKNPSYFQGKNRPVESVSWKVAKAFIEKLNSISKKLVYRLPSESEWEYAARGGKEWEKGFQYSGGNDLRKVGWYRENSHHETQDVGLKAPNQLGIYDMNGNVWEWCEDDFHESYKEAPNDGIAWIDSPERADDRVLRGGCWNIIADFCRVALRIGYDPADRFNAFGFRLAAALP